MGALRLQGTPTYTLHHGSQIHNVFPPLYGKVWKFKSVEDFTTVPLTRQVVTVHSKCVHTVIYVPGYEGFFQQYVWKRAVRITGKPHPFQRERLYMW